jgi:hypothetical protein
VRTRSTWMAWTMVAIFVVGCGIAVTLEVATGDFGQDAVTLYLAFTGFMVVGAVIIAHRPGNAIGWIFSAIGLLAATGTLAMEYAAYAYATRPGSLPAAIWAAWYQQQWWIPMLALVFVATPLLFPTGRLPSARWRPVAAVAALYQPARGRIQAVVDRRFNRRKYDAAKTVEGFTARLRDEVDLDTLSAELLTVVDQTMQSTTASLWLRSSGQAWPESRAPGA